MTTGVTGLAKYNQIRWVPGMPKIVCFMSPSCTRPEYG